MGVRMACDVVEEMGYDAFCELQDVWLGQMMKAGFGDDDTEFPECAKATLMLAETTAKHVNEAAPDNTAMLERLANRCWTLIEVGYFLGIRDAAMRPPSERGADD